LRIGTLLELGLAAALRAGAANRVREKMRRLAVGAVLLLVALLAFLAAAGAGIVTVWLALLPKLGPAGSALVVTAGLLVIGLLLLLAAWLATRRRRRAIVADPIGQLLGSKPGGSEQLLLLAVAALGGLALGLGSGRPGRRKD
jgi:hypothetical protein